VKNRLRARALLALLLVLPAAAALAAPSGEDPPWLGVYLADEVDGGVRIMSAYPGGPAARAGLRAGDVIVAVGEAPVAALVDLSALLSPIDVGQVVGVRVLRDGASRVIEVKLGHRPRAPSPPEPVLAPERVPRPTPPRRWIVTRAYDPLRGLRVTDITPDLREHLGASRDVGVLVVRVKPGGPAAAAGVLVGDVLVRVGEESVQATEGLESLLHSASAESDDGAVSLTVLRGKKSQELRLAIVEKRVVEPDAPVYSGGRESLERSLRREIDRLERRIDELRRQLENLDDN